MAKVDIVVSIYNVENYVFRTLLSLQQQTFSDIRILCIDDGSTDNSSAIIKKFTTEDKRFVYYHKTNGGLSDARNFGLDRVEAPYVMLIDGDDFCEKEMVQACVQAMEKDNSDMVVFPYYQYLLQENKQEIIPLQIEQGCYSLAQHKELLVYTPNAAWNKLYRSSLFLESGVRYPLGYRHQDFGTTAKLLARARKITYLSLPLYNYLLDRPNNITGQVDTKLSHIIPMSEEIIRYYQENGLFTTYQTELQALCFLNYRQSLRKAVHLQDWQFVNHFIDDIFQTYHHYFLKKKNPYIQNGKGDFVYQSRWLCKLYAYYQHWQKKLQGE